MYRNNTNLIKMFLNDVDWEQLNKDMKMKKYSIDKNRKPCSDMYFGVDIASSPAVLRYKVVLYDKLKREIVSIMDFTLWYIQMFDNIKKFFNNLKLKLVRRKNGGKI